MYIVGIHARRGRLECAFAPLYKHSSYTCMHAQYENIRAWFRCLHPSGERHSPTSNKQNLHVQACSLVHMALCATEYSNAFSSLCKHRVPEEVTHIRSMPEQAWNIQAGADAPHGPHSAILCELLTTCYHPRETNKYL